jgi:hypothetical protein
MREEESDSRAVVTNYLQLIQLITASRSRFRARHAQRMKARPIQSVDERGDL